MPRPTVKHPERTGALRQQQGYAVQRNQRSLADPVGIPVARDAQPRAVRDQWQPEAYAFTYAVPEVRYVISRKAEMLSQCLVRVEQRVPGKDQWEETEDPRAVAVLRALKPEIGEQGSLIGQASVHAEIAGNCWFYGDPIRNEMGRVAGFNWQFLSTSALKVERKGAVEIKTWGPGAFEHKAPPDGHVDAAMFYPDWEYPDRPKSPVFSILPLMKTLVLMRQLLDSMARRQTNADLFFLPEEMSFGPPNEYENPGTAATGMDEFEEELHDYTRDAQDQTSSARLNPLLLTGPGLLHHGDRAYPMKDLLGLIPLAKDFEGYLAAERAELLKAIARGLDIEPEILEGTARVNQWGSYMISESFITNHVVPLGKRIVEWLTKRYLIPMLKTAYHLTDMQAAQFRLVLDPSPILVDPDRSKIATQGYEMDIVSDAAWIEYAGLESSDMPEPDEVFRRFFTRLVSKFPELGPAVLPVIFPDKSSDVDAMLRSWPTRVGGGLADDSIAEPSPTAPPSRRVGQEPEPNPPSRSSIDSMTRVLATEADSVVRAVVERAAYRLIGNLASRDPDRAAALRKLPHAAVLSAAGDRLIRRAGLDVSTLIGDGFHEFESRATAWFADQMGDGDDVSRRAATAAGELVAQLRAIIANAVHEPMREGPDGLVVSPAAVRSALAAADLAPLATV